MLHSICFALLLLIVHVLAQKEIEFFYNTRLDICSFEGGDAGRDNLTANGGLCAYDRSSKRVYTCSFERSFSFYFYVFLHSLTLVAVSAGWWTRRARKEKNPEMIKYSVLL